MPAVSIAIPTYNAASFLPAAIDSIMRQGLEDFEIVVSDNASEDDTEAVISAMGNPHIRFFKNSSNLGSRENLKRCLDLVSGDYIKILCADDVLLDGVIIKQVAVLRQRAEVSLVTCNMIVTDSELRPQKVQYMYPGSSSGSRIKIICLSGLNNYIGGPSNFMFRRHDADNLTPDANYRWLSDLKFGLQLLERGCYANIDEVGYLYRRHAATDSALNCPIEIRLAEFFRLLDEFDGWNLLSWAQAIRRLGGFKHLGSISLKAWRACSIPRLWLTVSAGVGVLRMAWLYRARSARTPRL
jgi:glycosyltransferase involved in cell wall biosynthesis